MNYPFLYQILFRMDAEQLRTNIKKTQTTHVVWDDWVLQEIESDLLKNFVSEKFKNLEVLGNKFFISSGSYSNFHLDRFEYFHLTHRVLIPLDQNFHYEWVVDGKVFSYQPEAGQVLLMNNMVPHRFVSNLQQPTTREVVYFDLIDPAIKHHIKNFDKNYSYENGELDKFFASKKD